MNQQEAMPPADLGDRQDGLAWVQLQLGGDVFLGMQEAQKHMRNAYECIQRVELLIGTFKSGNKQP